MSIEITNFTPRDNENNVSTSGKIEFDIVATSGYIIDINTLIVKLEMSSKIVTDEQNYVSYDTTSESIVFNGTNPYYRVSVSPDIPFDEGQSVTVIINIEGVDDSASSYEMPEYKSSFHTRYNGSISDFRFAFIEATQNIPVYNEILEKDSTTKPKIFDSAFKRWNNNHYTKIRVNQVIFSKDDASYGHLVNHEDGLVIFNNNLAYNDQVDASYTFSFFSDDQIDKFFKMALAQYTVSPPYGGPSSIYASGQTLAGLLMVGASIFAYRDLLMQLTIQEKRIIFDNASWGDGWSKTQEIFKSLLEGSNEMWKNILEAKKVRLPAINAIISPVFTLPGGRSRMFRYLFK